MERKDIGSTLMLAGLIVHEVEEATFALAAALDQSVMNMVEDLLSFQPYHLVMWLAPIAGGALFLKNAVAPVVLPWLGGQSSLEPRARP